MLIKAAVASIVRRWRLAVPVIACTTSVVAPAVARAQSAENVALVINENSADSIAIGEYYAKARALPESNVFRIRTSTDETIDRNTFSNTIERPLILALARQNLQDRILYLVLTKGVPLRVSGTTGVDGTMASVDSELTLLYRGMAGEAISRRGALDNPYFLDSRELMAARPFSHREHDIYLVSRLDGYRADDVFGLIDRGTTATASGAIFLERRRDGRPSAADAWLDETTARLTGIGMADRVASPAPAAGQHVLAYFAVPVFGPTSTRATNVMFSPGAIAAQFTGGDGRTFVEPPAAWVPGRPYAGLPAPLVGDLVRGGVTGAFATVADPLLAGAVRPQILFPAYFAGFNLIEAFYLAMPRLSWHGMVIGDPLAAPFRRTVLSRTDLEDPEDPVTRLPAFFSRRRVALVAAQSGLPERAVALGIGGDAMLAAGQRDAARAAFEKAVSLAPRHPGALLRLGQMDDLAGQPLAAIEKYKRVLHEQPDNALALNNLAYSTAVHLKNPPEALPLAQRAAALSPQVAGVLDTLGWIRYLLGDAQGAAVTMREALQGVGVTAEIRLHAAIVFAAAGEASRARAELEEALRLVPQLGERDDTRRLQEELRR